MNMSGKGKTTEGHIIDQIQRTGYPLEIEVSDLMERAGWIVFNNQPYLDEDEGKTREIDIYAIHETEADQFVTEPKPRIFVGTDIVIECKKSTTHAWIFFTRPKGLPPGFGQDQTLDFLQVHSNGEKRFLSTVALPKLHYDKFHTIAHTYAEVKLQSESLEKREIFEASNQLMKYSAFEMEQWREAMASKPSDIDIRFVFLAVVFDGKLYEALTHNGKIELKERSHMLLKVARYSKARAGMSHYIIDMVSKAQFPEYLDLVEDDIQLIRSFFLSNEEHLLGMANTEVKALMPGVYVSKRAL